MAKQQALKAENAGDQEGLKKAKTDEVSVATEAIESKGVRAGALAVSVVQSQSGLDDASGELSDATKYLKAPTRIRRLIIFVVL